jgi:hypothetical protein
MLGTASGSALGQLRDEQRGEAHHDQAGEIRVHSGFGPGSRLGLLP